MMMEQEGSNPESREGSQVPSWLATVVTKTGGDEVAPEVGTTAA